MRLAALLVVSSALVLAGCSDSSTNPSESPAYPDIDGLVVFYPFDGDYDSTVGDAHHGTPSRGVTFVDGRPGSPGQAIHVDTDDFVTVPDHPDLDITGDVSAGAWVNPEASNRSFATLFCKGADDSYGMGMWGGMADPETTDFRVRISGEPEYGPSAVPMGMDVWSHIAFTFHDATNLVRFYLNGVKVDSGYVSSSLGVSDEDLLIGDHPSLGEYKGSVDDLAIFDRALTGAEIAQLYEF
jgi:hypothetical protein